MKSVGKLLRLGLAIFLLTWVYVIGLDLFLRQTGETPTSDVIVTLGADVFPDGQLTPSGLARLDQTLSLPRGPLTRFVTTGGFIQNRPSFGLRGAAYLEKNGIPAAQICTQAKSKSTFQDAYYAAECLQGTPPITLVTQATHMPRAFLTFRLMGFSEITPSLAAPPRDGTPKWLYHTTREVLAIWFNLARYPAYLAAKRIGLPLETQLRLLA